MASSDNVAHDERVKLRSYQQEMLDESLKRNVIVAMDTGSGKTHIAIARIQAELERLQPGKLIWFMAPSRPLSEQQCRLLQQHLPAYHVKPLTGADDVDKWTDQRLWDAFLTGVHVVVGTPAVLTDALTHAFVKISTLSLCIFDEAHRCIKNGPMNQIMRDFYYPAKSRGDAVPHVLGLSASPVMNRQANSGGLEAIESNLDATIITPKRFREDLETHVHLPELIKVTYGENAPKNTSSAYANLILEAKSYDIEQDPYVLELKGQDDDNARRLLSKTSRTGKTYCREQIQTLLNRANHIDSQLGNCMAEWYIQSCVRRYLDNRRNSSSLIVDVDSREKRHLEGLLGRVISGADGTSALNIDDTSEKAKALHDVLLNSAGTGLRSIIFVEQRAMVVALAELLRTPELSDLYNIGTFVGTSAYVSRKTFLDDVVDRRTQDQDLQEFRDGKKNLMIATNVLEEGIDIPACNGVICFDLPKSLISFVQRKGRAREADSKYILFVARDDLQADPMKWRRLEDQMKEAYMEDRLSADAVSGAEAVDEDTSSAKYTVHSTGALLTMDNARSHLHHFCAVARHASRYIDPRPQFDTQKNGILWTGSVTLPSFVHPSLRTAKSSSSWFGEQAAIKDAAFNAYIALHQAGLVNDNLLPALQDHGPEPGQHHIDQPTLVRISEQQSAWTMCTDTGVRSETSWYPSEVQLRLPKRDVLSQVLWLPFQIEAAESIQLHWNADVCYEASVRPVQHRTLSNDELEAAVRWTSLVLRSVFANRMPAETRDFAFLLSQPPNHAKYDLSGNHVGYDAISQHLAATRSHVDCGIVRVADQPGRAYILHGIDAKSERQCPESKNAAQEDQLIVTFFPKRRDFLHAPPESDMVNAAYTIKQSFPMSQCSVDRLPVDYSIFAVFLPPILHHVDAAFVACHLNTTLLSAVGIKDVALVSEAISAPAAREQVGDYNRLEYLGDCILKLCTELQVVAQHPTWPEAFLSSEKDRIVRNSNLAKAALEAGLGQYILTKPFTGSKWRPSCLSELMAAPKADGREVSSKVLADVVEALIGAAYVDGGLQKAYTCIRMLLPNETWWTHDLSFDKLLEESGRMNINLDQLEKLIGHKFARPSILLEAITHASHPGNQSGLSYERLEFLGDAVLDLVITPKLFAHARRLRHWELHRIHEALVNGYFLGYCCMALREEDQTFDIVNTSASKVPQMEAQASTRTYYLYDFIRASGQLFNAKETSISRLQALRDPIATALHSGQLYPWSEFAALRPEKFFSDIVEAVLGAICLDTRGDLGACERFLEKLGVLPAMRSILDREVETTFPKERVGILADREDVRYVTQEVDGRWECSVVVGKNEAAKSAGCESREEAELRAADAAAHELGRAVLEDGGRRKRRKLHVHADDEMEGIQTQTMDETDD